MLKILNEFYYLDLDAIDKFIQIGDTNQPVSLSGNTGETHLNVIKYETVKLMLEVLMSSNEEADESLGNKASNISIPFKFAFNTLINKGLIKKY